VPTQQSDAVGTALRQENLKGYITALGEYDLPRSGLVLLHRVRNWYHCRLLLSTLVNGEFDPNSNADPKFLTF